MSQQAVAAPESLPFELVYDDGEPLDSYWHVLQMELLLDVIGQAMAERGRDDFFAGGNMFVYYSVEQARKIAAGGPYFRGPDVFFVDGVERRPVDERKAWVSWKEGGRLPDLIVELLSPTTADVDRRVKKVVYARDFRTPEYFLFDHESDALEGLLLVSGSYRPITPNAWGRVWSQVLGLELGVWRGVYKREEATWLRLFHPDGRLVPTSVEAAEERAEAERRRAEAERQRAEAERQRAETAEAEAARLRALLGELGGQ